MGEYGFMKMLFVVGFVMLVTAVFCMADTPDVISVKVRAYSRVPGKNLFLKDIADITAPEVLKKKLEDLKISDSPMPGRDRRIPGSLILSRIKTVLSGNMKPETCAIPDLVIVDRASQEITESELKTLFYDSIKKKAGGRTFTLRDVTIRGERFIPAGEKDLMVDDKGLSKLSGRVSLTVLARFKEEKTQRIVVSGWVDLFDQVVCAGKDIPRGGRIHKNDLKMSEQNISKSPPGILMSTDQVEGNVAKTRIEKGSFIRDSMIAEPPLIRKGCPVKIVARNGLLTVVASGISKADGRLGEQIMVQNTRSNKNVTARVVSAETVEVAF